MGTQQSLFGPEPDPPGKPRRGGRAQPLGCPDWSATLIELGQSLPARIHLGTSSWTFPGWAGSVFDRTVSKPKLVREGLPVYSRHPLFRLVGVDRTYYAPMTREQFEAWVPAVPESFRFLIKASENVTVPRFPDHPRAGDRAGQDNPWFLDPAWARDHVVAPALDGLGDHVAVIVFQFSPLRLADWGGTGKVLQRLQRFLSDLPSGVAYAVEVRNRELLCPEYVEVLRSSSTDHCFNVHPSVPDLSVQRELFESYSGKHRVIRWMLQRGFRYQDALDRYQPFDRLVDEDLESRQQAADLCREAVELDIPAFVAVNNKAEGSAPMSIEKLAAEIVEGSRSE